MAIAALSRGEIGHLPVHVPRIVSHEQMEIAREFLTPTNFKVLNELIGRIEEASVGHKWPGYSEDSLRSRIRSLVNTADFIKARRDELANPRDPDQELKELVVSIE